MTCSEPPEACMEAARTVTSEHVGCPTMQGGAPRGEGWLRNPASNRLAASHDRERRSLDKIGKCNQGHPRCWRPFLTCRTIIFPLLLRLDRRAPIHRSDGCGAVLRRSSRRGRPALCYPRFKTNPQDKPRYFLLLTHRFSIRFRAIPSAHEFSAPRPQEAHHDLRQRFTGQAKRGDE